MRIPSGCRKIAKTVARYAHSFLRLKHEHEGLWEFTEFALISSVFLLMFIGYEEHSHLVGLISHALAAAFLLLKGLCVLACKLDVYFDDPKELKNP